MTTTAIAPQYIAYEDKALKIQDNSYIALSVPYITRQNTTLGALLGETDVYTALSEISKNNEVYEIIYSLIECESNFRNICITDTNGLLSCGILMFQYPTWLNYKCEGDYRNSGDQIRCAKRILEMPDGWRNWTNCLKYKYDK